MQMDLLLRQIWVRFDERPVGGETGVVDEQGDIAGREALLDQAEA